MSIKNREPVWQEALPAFIKVRDFVDGEDNVVKKKDKYILKFSTQMSDDEFKLYLGEVQLGGVTGAMHQSLSGAINRRDPKLTIPETEEWIKTDFGERGQGFDLWAQEIVDDQLISSNNWVFIDYPDVAVESQLDKEKQKIYPYPITIYAEQVLGTEVVMENSTEKLKEIRYETISQETSGEEDDYTYTPVSRIVKLFIGSDGYAHRQDYKDGEKDGDVTDFKINGQQLKRLPVFPLSGDFKPQVPLLKPMADLDKHITNKQSRANHHNYLMNTTTIITTGVKEADRDKLGALGGIWHLGEPEADAKTLGADPEVAAATKINMEADMKKAASLGARMFADDGKEAESGEALRIKNASVHATLGSVSNTLSNVVGEMLRFCILWNSDKEYTKQEVNVEFSKDFVPALLNGTDITAIVGARLQNAIPDRVFYEIMKKGERIGDDYTYDDWTTDLQAQIVTTPGNSGDDNSDL